MASFENDDQAPTPPISIYDMSFREIELIQRKLEADNMTLRRELHESRVKLNDKDEEILRLQRELLSQKKETLQATRKIMALTVGAEKFKMGQTQAINNFLLNIYEYNDAGDGKGSDSVVNCSALAHGQLLVSSPPAAKVESSAFPSVAKMMSPPPPKARVLVDKEANKRCPPGDDEQHVRAPLSCQYRHLRLQLRTNNPAREDDGDDCVHAEKKYLIESHDSNIMGTPSYEQVGKNANFA